MVHDLVHACLQHAQLTCHLTCVCLCLLKHCSTGSLAIACALYTCWCNVPDQSRPVHTQACHAACILFMQEVAVRLVLSAVLFAIVACYVFAAGLVVPGNSWGSLDTALVAAHNDAPLGGELTCSCCWQASPLAYMCQPQPTIHISHLLHSNLLHVK